MAKQIEIGANIFKYKKDALAFYKAILNSYKFGSSLNKEDFDYVVSLIEYSPEHKTPYEMSLNFTDNPSEVFDLGVVNIKVSEVQFKTKCFEVFWNDESSEYISYISLINRYGINYHKYFTSACRSCIQDDLIALKQKFFSKNAIEGFVNCQETNIASKWDDLVVDHRQPNTFSVIVDRFKELNQIDIQKIEYITDDDNKFIFADKELFNNFKSYHKEKANLRIVRKEKNLSRTYLAKLKRSTKDLKID